MPSQTIENLNGPISMLNVGAKILLRDAMDQYIRTLGDIRTFYASNMEKALRFFEDNMIHILICEVSLEDGSAQRLLKELGQRSIQDDLWVILALEEKREDLLALSVELGANSVLIRPFAAADLKVQLEKYASRKAAPTDKGVELIRDGEQALKERRNFDADKRYKEAVVASPQNLSVLYHAAQYFLSKPDFGLAEQCLKKAIEIRPEYVAALSMLGGLELQRGNLDKAYEFLSKAHQLSPLNTERSLLIEKYYLQKAAEMANRVFNIDEVHPSARLELGKLFVHQKDYVGGLLQLERAYGLLKDDNQRKECQTYMALARKLGNIQK